MSKLAKNRNAVVRGPEEWAILEKIEMACPDQMKWEIGDWINEHPKELSFEQAIEAAQIILLEHTSEAEKRWMAEAPTCLRPWIEKGLKIIEKHRPEIQRLMTN